MNRVGSARYADRTPQRGVPTQPCGFMVPMRDLTILEAVYERSRYDPRAGRGATAFCG